MFDSKVQDDFTSSDPTLENERYEHRRVFKDWSQRFASSSAISLQGRKQDETTGFGVQPVVLTYGVRDCFEQ